MGERGETDSERFGLMGMRERVQALGGEFQLKSVSGAGLTVIAYIPVGEPGSAEAAQDLRVVAR